jgi:hypothetical protein
VSAPARADRIIAVGGAFDGPWLAGTGHVVFGWEDPTRVYRVRLVDAHGRRSTLASFRFRIRPQALNTDLVRVAAGTGGVVVVHGVPRDPEGENDPQTAARIVVRAGPVRGPLAPVLSCPFLTGPTPYGAGLASPAADGPLLATVGSGCRTDVVAVFRAADGHPVRTVTFDGFVSGIRMNGRWLAAEMRLGYGDPGSSERAAWIVLVDLVTGTEALRFDVPGHRYASGFDVDRDGTILLGLAPPFDVARPPGQGCPAVIDMAVASPQAPEMRRLPLHACPGVLQLDGGRVLFTHPAGLQVHLALGSLRGSGVLDVGRFRRSTSAGGADLAGDRVAWLERRCAGSVVHVRGVRDRAPAAAPAPCRVLVTGHRPLRLSRDGAVVVPISCPDGCRRGTVRVCHADHDCGPRMVFTLRAGKPTGVRVPLGARTLAWLRMVHPRTIRIRIVTTENWAAAPVRTFRRTAAAA